MPPAVTPTGHAAEYDRSGTTRDLAAPASAQSAVERALRSPRALLALVLVGVALRCWQLLAGISLWLDETLLARNILELPLRTLLTEPLAIDQVAPRGFLLAEKLAVLAFGPHDWALRLFPFAVGLATLPLFRRLAERTLDGLAVPFAVAAFAIGVPFIRYTIEVKQYGADIFATVALLLLALDLRDRDRSAAGLVGAALAGAGLLLFSQAAALVATGVGAALAVLWLRDRDTRTRRALVGVVPVWAIAVLAAVVAGERSMTPSTRAFMQDFWRPGFLPLPFDLARGARWFGGALLDPFGDPWLLRYPVPLAALALAVLGVLTLARHRPAVALLVLAPVFVTLGAAVAQRYPFRTRLVLFLLPLAVLMLSAGAEWLRRLGARRDPRLGGALMVGALALPLWALVDARMPVVAERNREVAAYIARHRQPGDAIYLLQLASYPFMYYAPRFGIAPHEWTPGTCDRFDTRAFVRQLDEFRGRRRVWVVLSGQRPLRTARAAIRRYLQTIGVPLDSLTLRSAVFAPTLVELYDLGDPARLARASAETIPVDPMPTDPRPGCRRFGASPLEELRARAR